MIQLELKNVGEKAILFKIDKKMDDEIFCSQLNSTIENKEKIALQINTNRRIRSDDLCYEFDIYLKDVDNRIYIQTFKGKGIYPEVSLPKKN